MATITYGSPTMNYTPWQLAYDATSVVTKAFLRGYVGYFGQNTDGMAFNVTAHNGMIVAFDWMDYGALDMTLMHADLSMDPTAFLAALSSPNNASRKVVAVLLAGDDVITGSRRGDYLTGMAGNDSIAGGRGNDRIDGGAGNDTLDGGIGIDRLTGGAGADIFRFGADAGLGDTILDFHPGEDRIDLRPTGAALVFGGNVLFDAATGHLTVDLNGLPGAEIDIALRGVAALGAADLILA